MHRMEGGAFAYATQHGTQHGAEGVTRHHSIQSNQSPRAIRAMVESGVNSNVIFSFKGYGPIRSIGELTTCYRGSTTGDQPASQLIPVQVQRCQAQEIMETLRKTLANVPENVTGHDKQKIEAISTASRWWSTSRDYPAFTANSKSIHEQGFMNSGEVINPRCSKNRGSAQHFWP